MSQNPTSVKSSRQVPPSDSRKGPIDDVCTRFEATWNSGHRPKLEDFLVGWEEPELSKLLCELLQLELQYASREGDTLTLQVYLARFPNHGHVLSEAFDHWSMSKVVDTGLGSADTLVMDSQFAGMQFHAQGGLGVVFRAEDQNLSREVAVKFIRSTLAADVDCRDRFRMEAEITSRLEHPGVVPVYGFGSGNDGSLFYAMRFIEGETLEEAIDRFHEPQSGDQVSRAQREFQQRELLGRFIALCKTIAYAHNRCIVHRDIKPQNVMLGLYGETIVIDWGLAIPVDRQGVFKHSEEKTLLPSSGSHPSGLRGGGGTPAYMSPEQVSGSSVPTPASDIYSLGVTLYKILVGQVPFSGKLDRIFEQVSRGEFKLPTRIDRHVSKTLEAICLKAMALNPRDRYVTAMDLANDVENYLADATVSAYREPVSTKFFRWTRRHRMLSQVVLVGLLLLTVGGISAALLFGQLRANAVSLQQSEHELRKHSLAVSARFAARTMANNVDIRLRILEKEADDLTFHDFLTNINRKPLDRAACQPLQDWLDARVAQYTHIKSYSWSIFAQDGTQVARYPSRRENGELYDSLFKNFAYRDYFHGQGKDYATDYRGAPLTEPKFSVAIASVNDADLIVSLAVPIRDNLGNKTAGVIGMSIELGKFADLGIPLPEGQMVLLVDTRAYYMTRPSAEEERGEGLVLHHKNLGNVKNRSSLSHVDDATVKRLRDARKQWDSAADVKPLENLLSDTYRDPLEPESDGAWLAAFAPVLLSSRPVTAKVHDTGCFVIIQQRYQKQ